MNLIYNKFLAFYSLRNGKLALLILIICANLVSCKSNQDAETTLESTGILDEKVVLSEAQLKNADIETSTLKKMNVGGKILLAGKVINAPQNLVSIHAPIGGFIKKFNWMVGMPVKKGDIIATLEDKAYIQIQQDYLLTKSAFELAQEEFERQKELNKTKASSDKILSQSASALQSKKIELKALSEQLKLIHINVDKLSSSNITSAIHIYSPISGYISASNGNVGKYVQPNESLAEIVNNSETLIALKVYEKDVAFISIGDLVNVFTNQDPEVKKVGRVIYMGRNITSEGFTEITCRVESTIAWLPGMYLNGEVLSLKTEKYVLPEDAIVNFESKNYVFVLDEKESYSMVEVKTGMQENGFIEIVNNELFLNKKIVTKGAYTLLMKLKNKEE